MPPNRNVIATNFALNSQHNTSRCRVRRKLQMDGCLPETHCLNPSMGHSQSSLQRALLPLSQHLQKSLPQHWLHWLWQPHPSRIFPIYRQGPWSSSRRSCLPSLLDSQAGWESTITVIITTSDEKGHKSVLLYLPYNHWRSGQSRITAQRHS
jgi:hypothetical protein